MVTPEYGPSYLALLWKMKKTVPDKSVLTRLSKEVGDVLCYFLFSAQLSIGGEHQATPSLVADSNYAT